MNKELEKNLLVLNTKWGVPELVIMKLVSDIKQEVFDDVDKEMLNSADEIEKSKSFNYYTHVGSKLMKLKKKHGIK